MAGWLQHPAPLDRLVIEKLQAEAEDLRAEGWKCAGSDQTIKARQRDLRLVQRRRVFGRHAGALQSTALVIAAGPMWGLAQ